MKSCKAKDSNGKPCTNKIDDGQEYCPYHLSSQNTQAKTILSIAGAVLGVVVTGVVAVIKIVTKRT